MDPVDQIRKTFNRYRFVVEVEADPDAIVEQVPLDEPRDALQSEIRSNLESLDGIRSVTVEPVA